MTNVLKFYDIMLKWKLVASPQKRKSINSGFRKYNCQANIKWPSKKTGPFVALCFKICCYYTKNKYTKYIT